MSIQDMMRQAQAIQKQMAELQTKLGDTEVEAQSGGGMVKVVMTCKGDMRKIKIAPELATPQDVETLEDLIVAAVNAARAKADQTVADETRKMMESFGLPPDFKLPGT